MTTTLQRDDKGPPVPLKVCLRDNLLHIDNRCKTKIGKNYHHPPNIYNFLKVVEIKDKILSGLNKNKIE